MDGIEGWISLDVFRITIDQEKYITRFREHSQETLF